mgnify:CR=1 FL=1
MVAVPQEDVVAPAAKESADRQTGGTRLVQQLTVAPEKAPDAPQYVTLKFEQVVGTYEYPRAEIDLRKYFMLHERQLL